MRIHAFPALAAAPRQLLRHLTSAACVVALAIGSASLNAGAASGSWEPICPDNLSCVSATTLPNGKVSVNVAQNGLVESRDLSLDDFSLSTPAWVCLGIKLPSGNCLTGDAFNGGTVFAPDGTALYTFNPTGWDGLQRALQLGHEKPLGVLRVDATSPPTVAMPMWGGSGPYAFVSTNEGRTWQVQRSDRTVAVVAVSPDGEHVWGASTLHESAVLWQTPSPATTGGRLDFAKLERVDNGSFPAAVSKLFVTPRNAALPDGYGIAVSAGGLYVSTDAGVSWRQVFAGPVDSFVQPLDGDLDVQAIAAGGSVFLSRDRGATWIELGGGLPHAKYALSATGGTLIASGDGIFACRALDCAGPGFARVVTHDTLYARVSEFFNPVLKHYFLTADEGEKSYIRNGGAGREWMETGQEFWAWSQSSYFSGVYVCRYYGDTAAGPNSHFYSASANECRGLLALQQSTPDGAPRWNSEGYAFKVGPPNAVGRCSGAMVPVYRAYNNGAARGIDSNHRFVTDRTLLEPLVAAGWIDEGIAFCVPPANHP